MLIFTFKNVLTFSIIVKQKYQIRSFEKFGYYIVAKKKKRKKN